MSYPPAINPDSDDFNPNLLSIVVMTTFTNPFTTIPEIRKVQIMYKSRLICDVHRINFAIFIIQSRLF